MAGPNLLANGDLEEHKGDRFTGWGFHDDPGKVSFADTETVASGKCSIRYELAEAKRLHAVLGYRKSLLAMDEIRNGGGCRSCQERKLTMGEILGDCVARQREIFRKIDPGIEVMIWSDMLGAFGDMAAGK